MNNPDGNEGERLWLRRLQALEQELRRELRKEEEHHQGLCEALAQRGEGRLSLCEDAIRQLHARAASLLAETASLRADLMRLRASWFYKPFALVRRIEETLRRRARPVSEAGVGDVVSGLRYSIDTLSDCIFRGTGDLSGWCLAVHGPLPRAVRARIEGRIFDGVYGTPRPDIGRGFPDVPNAARCGFHVHLEIPEGVHEAVLEILLGDEWWNFASLPVVSLPPPLLKYYFCLDTPQTFAVALDPDGELTIAGWCVAGVGGRIHGIRVWINDAVFVGEHGLPRPDVVRLLPNVPFSGNGGFLIRARVSPGRLRFRLQARDGAGAWQDVTVREHQVYSGKSRDGEPETSPTAVTLPDAAAYRRWFERVRPASGTLEDQRHAAASWNEAPLLSVVIPCYNTPPRWFEDLLISLRAQTYPRFECIVVDDASPRKAHLEIATRVAAGDKRFQLIKHKDNLGVGGATRTGADACTGEYVLVADHDDLLEPDALFEIAQAARAGGADVIYTDELLVDQEGRILAAALRPSFSYDYLLSHPYIVHLTAIRRELLVAAGGYDARLSVSQDYDLLLRVAALTRRFRHVPKALYRWRIHSASTGHRQAGLVMDISREALRRHLRLAGRNEAEAWVEDGMVMNSFRVRYWIPPAKVSVVLRADSGGTAATEWLRNFWERTRIPEGVVVEITVAGPRGAIGEDLRRLGYRIIEQSPEQPVAALLNAAAGASDADYLLFMDAGVAMADENWLHALLEPLAQHDVAAVGGKLVNPCTGWIEHAGVIVGFDGAVGLEHRGFPELVGGLPFPGHGQGLVSLRDCSALSGACLIVKRRDLLSVGGFDATYGQAFHDFDLGLRLRAAGRRCVFTPYARLFWNGMVPPSEADRARFIARWADALQAGDPFYNPNLSRAGRMFWPAE